MEVLRDSWAAPLLGGRYVVVDRLAETGAVRELLYLADLVDTPRHVQEVVVDGRVLLNSNGYWTLRTVDQPRRPVLQVRTARRPGPRYVRKSVRQWLNELRHGDHTHLVVDLPDTWVGSVVVRRSPGAVFRYQLYEPGGRLVASVASAGDGLPVVDPGGAVAGRMWRTERGSDTHVAVDVSAIAHRADPRLVLACALVVL